MKILYACCDNSEDENAWSGLPYYMRKALERSCLSVEVYDRIPFECPLALRLYHRFYKYCRKQVHNLQIEPAILQTAARRVEKRFYQLGCDAVFCPGSGTLVNTFIDPLIPVFTYLDATKRSWIETYFGLGTLCKRSRKLVEIVDRHGLENNALTIFSSEWALQEAIRDYGISDKRAAVVPFGANLKEVPTAEEVEGSISARDRKTCRLLFLGKEWERKGGPLALKTLSELKRAGVLAELDVVGCTPEIPGDLQESVRVHGFVDRSKAEGSERFRNIVSQSHFLLFLSVADASPLALCEANAFGVPVIASDVGGIATIVRSGCNGVLLPLPIQTPACADHIRLLMQDWPGYVRLARSSRFEFEQRLNWEAAGARLRELIESGVENAKL